MDSSKDKPQPDSVDLFMQSIAETIKQFPKNKISKVKMQILGVVNVMEEEICADQTTIVQLVPSQTLENVYDVVHQQPNTTMYDVVTGSTAFAHDEQTSENA